MKLFFALLTGLIFGAGIAVSGMMDPAKVLNFFDVVDSWDPSLAFVMGGALIITFTGYRLTWMRDEPLFERTFQVPNSVIVDAKLVAGSALFGVGWGIAGFCPGAAIPALGTGRWEVALFLVAVVGGFYLHRVLSSAFNTNSKF